MQAAHRPRALSLCVEGNPEIATATSSPDLGSSLLGLGRQLGCHALCDSRACFYDAQVILGPLQAELWKTWG